MFKATFFPKAGKRGTSIIAIILKFFIDGIECQQLVMNHEDLIGARDKIQSMC
ncbi:hypothetical protein BFJ67_g8838 [Fusarium oxysporum f. sp. cepae]|nr:hypothetical protein BFJ67_g8838 [Fusarium oxysporum f. sp. cepae]